MKLELGLGLSPDGFVGPAGVVTSGLVQRYKFLEGSGTTVADSGSNGNNAGITTPVTWGTWTGTGGTIVFNNASEMLQYTRPFTANTYTASFWVKPSAGNINYCCLIGSTNGVDIGIYFRGSTSKLTCTTAGTERLSTGTVSVGAWHHVCLVVSASVATLYIDGVQDGSTFAFGATGGFVRAGNDSVSEIFVGEMAHMCFYNIALTSQQVTQNFQNP